MKKIIFVLIGLQFVFSQSPSKAMIKNSGQYYYGEGVARNTREARDRALSNLTSQIAVRISSSFEDKIRETDDNVTKSTQQILKTHSTATLKNVQTMKQPVNNGKIEVFCYLKKSQVEKIFNERKKLISEIVEKAEEYEEGYNYAYALKNYYFANLLLNSLPDQNITYEGTNYTTLIPKKINNIILNVKFDYVKSEMISEKEREITLKVTADGHPISLLDFTFWDGSNQISVQARDGRASVRLVGSSVDFETLKINVKYSYYQRRKEYQVVKNLWDLVTKPNYNSVKKVDLVKNESHKLNRNTQISSQSDSLNIQMKSESDSVPGEEIARKTNKLLTLLSNDNIEKIQRICKQDSFLAKKLKNYIKFNNPAPKDKNITTNINETEEGWEVRKIRMLHRYPSINKQKTEYLVLDFSSEGELRDINVAITEALYNKFVKQGEFANDWGNRQQIIKFLEKYRTAYLTRNIKTIKKMFAEDALIIVGRKIKEKSISPEKMYDKGANQPEYEYLRLKKREYINRQKRIFNSQKDIFLGFATFEINRKNNQPNIYGVEMRQNYSSTNYSDQGYLFLLIDFSEKNPTIYVRAWQPDQWNEEELIRTANFKVYK